MRLCRPRTVGEALATFDEDPEGSLYYAGGLDVVFGLKTGALTCSSLIDTKGIEGAIGITRAADTIRVGAGTKHHTIATSQAIRTGLPLLALACGGLATIRIRIQGTIGGNFGQGLQSTDPGTAALVHGGYIDLAGGKASRTVPVEDFWAGSGLVALTPRELIEAVRLRPLGSEWLVAHDRIEQRHRPPTAIVSMAARLSAGEVTEIRIAVGGVSPRPRRLNDLESALVGVSWEDLDRSLADAEAAIGDQAALATDELGSADIKAALLTGLIRRAAAGLTDREPWARGPRAMIGGGRNDPG